MLNSNLKDHLDFLSWDIYQEDAIPEEFEFLNLNEVFTNTFEPESESSNGNSQNVVKEQEPSTSLNSDENEVRRD